MQELPEVTIDMCKVAKHCGLPMPTNLRWIPHGEHHVVGAWIKIFGHEIIELRTTAWPHSEYWCAWRDRVLKLAELTNLEESQT